MKAVKADKYGGPDVLYVSEVPKPSPKQGQVLVKIVSSAVTPTDTNFQKGEPTIVRLFSGLTSPKGTPGDVFAGVVEAIGEEVSNFKVGDEVFGTIAPSTGTHAEYVCVKCDKVITLKPSNLSFEEAASIVDGPLTSNAFLTKIAKLKAGQKVLINGASGSVGIAAVELAKHFGAEVTAVCSTRNIDFVRSLGADHVIDYTQEDFTKGRSKYDIIYDTVWKSSYSACQSVLAQDGMYMTTGPSLDILVSYLKTRFTKQKAVMGATGPFWKQSELEFIADLAEKGIIKPHIDSRYSLDQISDAYQYVGEGHKVGSVILDI